MLSLGLSPPSRVVSLQNVGCSKVRLSAAAFARPVNSKPAVIFRSSVRRSTVCAALDNDDVEMSPEEIKQAYEALYGPSWERKKATETTANEEDDERGGGRRRRGEEGAGGPPGGGMGPGRRGAARDGFEESVVQVRRVTKVVKGGKQLKFRVVSVVGNKKGKVGVGVGKAKEVITAVQKAVKDARKNLVTVRMTKYKTIPHRVEGHYHAADVMLRPACVGSGVLAGGAVRVVLELSGIENALGKQLGSDNCLNNARATLHALSKLRTFKEVAELRGIPVQQLYIKR